MDFRPDSFAESRLDQSLEFWGPPLASTGTFGGDDNSLREKNVFFQPLEENDFAEPGASFGPRRKLIIVGSVIVAALGITALAYIWTSPGEKTAAQSEQPVLPVQSSQAPPQSEQSAPPVQSSQAPPQAEQPVLLVQSSQAPPQPSPETASSKLPDPAVAVAWPDLPGSITVDTSKVAPAAPSGPDTPRPTVSLSQKPDTVFLQRPGVNIRSAPSTNADVVGKAPKGMRFKVTNREGDWVQVESAQFSGWIKSQFLAANKPGRGALHRGGRVNARLRLWYYY